MFRLIGKIVKYCFYAILFIFILLSVLPYVISLSNSTNNDEFKPFSNSRFIRTPDNFIHYRVFKPDTVKNKIILLHGFAGSTFCFRNNFKALVRNSTLVVALDLPAYGFSCKEKDANFNDTTILNLIYKIITLNDKELNSSAQWVIAGHSLGAAYASKLVSRYPSMFKKQIFIDGFFEDLQETGFNSFLKYPPLLRWSDVALEYYFLKKEKFNELLESAYTRKPTDEEVEGYMSPFRVRNSASAILHWAHAESLQEVDKLIIYGKPTLIIWGNPDPWVPFDSKKTDTTAFKKLTFKFVDGGGHNPQETRPDIVNKYLIDFVNN